MPMTTTRSDAPGDDCPLCPRLATFRRHWRAAEPSWFNAPVPAFGDEDARLVIVGLAPGLRGANRTGRPFTGDYAGDLLYQTLIAHGYATGTYRARPDDGLRLTGAAIVNGVRCVPPENKPTGEEIAACRPFLADALDGYRHCAALLALGRIAHETTLRTLHLKPSAYPFGHGAVHSLDVGGRRLALFDSYHCSRYNTNTGRLTTAMFEAVFEAIDAHLKVN